MTTTAIIRSAVFRNNVNPCTGSATRGSCAANVGQDGVISMALDPEAGLLVISSEGGGAVLVPLGNVVSLVPECAPKPVAAPEPARKRRKRRSTTKATPEPDPG